MKHNGFVLLHDDSRSGSKTKGEMQRWVQISNIVSFAPHGERAYISLLGVVDSFVTAESYYYVVELLTGLKPFDVLGDD